MCVLLNDQRNRNQKCQETKEATAETRQQTSADVQASEQQPGSFQAAPTHQNNHSDALMIRIQTEPPSQTELHPVCLQFI